MGYYGIIELPKIIKVKEAAKQYIVVSGLHKRGDIFII